MAAGHFRGPGGVVAALFGSDGVVAVAVAAVGVAGAVEVGRASAVSGDGGERLGVAGAGGRFGGEMGVSLLIAVKCFASSDTACFCLIFSGAAGGAGVGGGIRTVPSSVAGGAALCGEGAGVVFGSASTCCCHHAASNPKWASATRVASAHHTRRLGPACLGGKGGAMEKEYPSGDESQTQVCGILLHRPITAGDTP